GPVQLSYQEKEVSGQGRAHHAHGFSSPFGRWKAFPDKLACELTDAELEKIGIRKGQKAKLEFVSGFLIEGEIVNWIREGTKLGILQWKNCKVTQGKEVYY